MAVTLIANQISLWKGMKRIKNSLKRKRKDSTEKIINCCAISSTSESKIKCNWEIKKPRGICNTRNWWIKKVSKWDCRISKVIIGGNLVIFLKKIGKSTLKSFIKVKFLLIMQGKYLKVLFTNSGIRSMNRTRKNLCLI